MTSIEHEQPVTEFKINDFEALATTIAAVTAVHDEDHPLLNPGYRNSLIGWDGLADDWFHTYRGQEAETILEALGTVARGEVAPEYQLDACWVLTEHHGIDWVRPAIPRHTSPAPELEVFDEPTEAIWANQAGFITEKLVKLIRPEEIIAAEQAVDSFAKSRAAQAIARVLASELNDMEPGQYRVVEFSGRKAMLLYRCAELAAERDQNLSDAELAYLIRRGEEADIEPNGSGFFHTLTPVKALSKTIAPCLEALADLHLI